MAPTEAAIEEQRSRWGLDTAESAAWDARALVDQVRKGGQPGRAAELGDEALAHWPQHAPLRGAVAWALYDRDVKSLGDKTTREQRQAAKASVDRIKTLSADELYGTYSAWPQALLKLAKTLAENWPATALEQLARADPDQLSAESSGDFPSLRARWHLTATKALEDLGRWDDLRAACVTAHATGGLRQGDALWIRFREATVLSETGRNREAIELLRALRKQKNEWWVDARLAKCYRADGDLDAAMSAARRSLTSPGPLQMRLAVLQLLAEVLDEQEPELAGRHLQLARTLRTHAGWPPDPALEALADARPSSDLLEVDTDLPGLRRWWAEAPDPSQTTGVVASHLPGGGSGFITPDDGSPKIYFAMPRNAGAAPPAIGTRVTFLVKEAMDHKKNRMSNQAVNIRVNNDNA